MSKEAMKLALELALDVRANADARLATKAIILSNVLLAALAEQPAQQEPCGWQFFQDGKWHNGMETNNHRANTEAAGFPVRDVYPSPPALATYTCGVCGVSMQMEQPAREWVGLTTDEVYKLHTKAIADNHRHLESRRGKQLGREDERIAFYARAIEAKLKEKNV